MAGQSKMWEAKLDTTTPRPKTAPGDSRQLFEDSFAKAIELECQRSYRSPARKEAAQRFPIEREREAILETLKEALDDESSESLKKRLTRLPRRGGS